MKTILKLAALSLLTLGAWATPSFAKETKATFAGGCFWCMESPFEKLYGVKTVISGYTGGKKNNPTYREVASGATRHVEAVQVTFDSDKIEYDDLLEVFWRQIDPTDKNGQFVDRGHQYTTAIYFHSKEQEKLAQISKKKLGSSGRFDKPIATRIEKATTFYAAEPYHQDYYITNPDHYKKYRKGSGRDRFIDKAWGKDRSYKPKSKGKAEKTSFQKPSKAELKKQLTPIQFEVTQEDGTERPFKNAYWDNKQAGIYVDIVSGEPLFSSKDKYKSGTGWPSFTQPIDKASIVEKTDRKLFVSRTEVRSKLADSHLGHVFDDGPAPTGLRYCINSAALRFIPKEKLASEGYEAYAKLVE
jgi:peptide methionine sulfoxide reductase msrA/msrB